MSSPLFKAGLDAVHVQRTPVSYDASTWWNPPSAAMSRSSNAAERVWNQVLQERKTVPTLQAAPSAGLGWVAKITRMATDSPLPLGLGAIHTTLFKPMQLTDGTQVTGAQMWGNYFADVGSDFKKNDLGLWPSENQAQVQPGTLRSVDQLLTWATGGDVLLGLAMAVSNKGNQAKNVAASARALNPWTGGMSGFYAEVVKRFGSGETTAALNESPLDKKGQKQQWAATEQQRADWSPVKNADGIRGRRNSRAKKYW